MINIFNQFIAWRNRIRRYVYEKLSYLYYRLRLIMRYALRRLLWGIIMLVLITAIVAGLGWSIPSIRSTIYMQIARVHIPLRIDQLFIRLGFAVSDVTVAGRQRASRTALRDAVGTTLGASIWQLDLQAIYAQLARVDWVRNVHVRRILPDIIHIELDEYQPFALLHRDDAQIVIARDGSHITRRSVDKWEYLPSISGAGAEYQVAALMDILADFPRIRSHFKSAEWHNMRRWTLHLNHGSAIHLPAQDIRTALSRLMILERRRRVLHVSNQTIDLRLRGQIVLGTRDASLFKRDDAPPVHKKIEVSL